MKKVFFVLISIIPLFAIAQGPPKLNGTTHSLELGTYRYLDSLHSAASGSIVTPSVLYTSPISLTVSSGVLGGTMSLITQSINSVFAGPASGSSATPTFRALVANDIPSLDASKISTGLVSVARGGNGTSTPGFVAGTNVSLSGTWPTQTINVSVPSAGGSLVNTSGVYSFINDNATPGNNKFYGTDGGGVKGWFQLNLTNGFVGTLQAAQEPAHTGDVTNAAGNLVLTLATVNGAPATYGGANTVAQFAVNGKGLVTSASNVVIALPYSQLTGIPSSTANYLHTIFTPTTGGTITLVNNQYNIINPAGALLALTVNLPSSPGNNDVVYIKFTQNVTTVTYANGTVVDGITAPSAGGLTVLTYDSGTSSWY